MVIKKSLGDVNFKRITLELEDLHTEYPDIRLGTFIQTAVDTRKKQENFDLNNVSSKEILSSIKDYRKMMKEKSVKKLKGEKRI